MHSRFPQPVTNPGHYLQMATIWTGIFCLILLVPEITQAQGNQRGPNPNGMRGQQGQQQGQGGQRGDIVQQMMNQFDQDGDGMLNVQELGQFMRFIHQRQQSMQRQGGQNQGGQMQGGQEGVQQGQQRSRGGQSARGQSRGGGGTGGSRSGLQGGRSPRGRR